MDSRRGTYECLSKVKGQSSTSAQAQHKCLPVTSEWTRAISSLAEENIFKVSSTLHSDCWRSTAIESQSSHTDRWMRGGLEGWRAAVIFPTFCRLGYGWKLLVLILDGTMVNHALGLEYLNVFLPCLLTKKKKKTGRVFFF